MDGFLIVLILIGIAIIVVAVNSIKDDIKRSDRILDQSQTSLERLSQLLQESVDTIEELDAFSEYVIDRIEQKVKWAKEEIGKERLNLKDDIIQNNEKGLEKEDDIKKVENEFNIDENRVNIDMPSNDEKQKDDSLASKEEIYKKAFELYNSGIGLDEIASKLKIGKSEAALALKIMRRKYS